MELDKRIVEAAVNWWADRIDGSIFHSNGDSSNGSIMAGIFADMLMAPVSKEKIEAYKDALAKRINETWAKSRHDYIVLDCDYRPDRVLSDAARYAGVPLGNYPWKAFMTVTNKAVLACDGYGKPAQTIFDLDSQT